MCRVWAPEEGGGGLDESESGKERARESARREGAERDTERAREKRKMKGEVVVVYH